MIIFLKSSCCQLPQRMYTSTSSFSWQKSKAQNWIHGTLSISRKQIRPFHLVYFPCSLPIAFTTIFLQISGDITQKGYEKKRRKLLLPFMTPEGSGGGSGKLPSVTELVTQRQQSDDPSLHRQSSVASSIGQATNNTDQPTQLHQVWPLTQLFSGCFFVVKITDFPGCLIYDPLVGR